MPLIQPGTRFTAIAAGGETTRMAEARCPAGSLEEGMRDIFPAGEFAYSLGWPGMGLMVVVDMREPTQPQIVASDALSGWGGTIGMAFFGRPARHEAMTLKTAVLFYRSKRR